MGWFTVCSEFIGSAGAALIHTSAKLKQKELVESTDFCPDETKQLISKSLEVCKPASRDLSWLGRRLTHFNLEKNDYFGSLIAINAGTRDTKRAICIVVLKTAAKCICSAYNEDAIRAVTYSYLALNN